MNKGIRFLLVLAFVVALLFIAMQRRATVAALDPPTEVWVCPTGNCGHPGVEYATIQEGVAAVAAGGTVHVMTGTYVLTSTVNVSKAVTVDGEGSTTTIVEVSYPEVNYAFYITAGGVTLQNLQIKKTDKDGLQNLIYIGASNVTVKDNLIWGQYVLGDTDVSRAFEVAYGSANLLIQGNTIHSLRQPGYFNGSLASPTTGDITGNHVYGTRGWVMDGANMTFTNNTWGTGAQANYLDIVILAATDPSYYPDIVAVSEANNDAVVEDQRPSPAVLSDVFVDDDAAAGGDGTVTRPYQTIGAAIPRVVARGTIKVAAGTYSDCLNIDTRSDLNIVGADKTTTIIKPNCTYDWNVGGYGSSRKAAVRVVSSTDIDFSNLTFDFDLIKGNNIIGVFYWDSTGTLNNNILKNMSLPDTSGYYYEITSYVRAPSYDDSNRAVVAFTGNTFINTGRLGIVTHEYVTVTVSSNTFYKALDDFGYAMEIGSQSVGTISGNTIYGYDTPAASDGSESAGIYVENCFTGGSPHVNKYVWITGNEIYDCQWALYVGNKFSGYAGDVDIVLAATGNNFHDNDDGAVVVTDEDKSAGSSVTATFSGNTLSGNGGYGYYLYTQGDGDLTVLVDGDVITGHDVGMHLEDTAGGGSGSSYDIALHDCDIHGNTTYGVENTYSGTTIDAELNYWGDPSGPYDPNGTTEVPPCTDVPASERNADGTGDAVSDNVDYCPWLEYVPPEVELQEVLNASCGETVYLGPYEYEGGLTIGCGVTLRGVPGTVIKHGSHGITVTANDVTIDSVTLDGTGGDPGDCGIWVVGGVERLWVRKCEIKNWLADGIHFAGGVTGLKIVDNYIHSNGGDGIEFNGSPAGTVQIDGNAFRSNTGFGVNAVSGSVTAEYNEWGDIAGPAGANGDGVSGTVDYVPWTFGKVYADVVPDPPRVRELETIDVDIKVDTHELFGAQFALAFDPDKLEVITYTTTGTGYFEGSQPSTVQYYNITGTLTYRCTRGPADNPVSAEGVKLVRITFRAKEISGVSASATINITDTSVKLGSVGGINIFVDSVTDDSLTILGTTTVSGIVDVQGRDNDSGAGVDPQPGQAYGWDPGSVTTGPWGTYSFSNMTDDTYEFRIEMVRYLDASANVAVSGDDKTLNMCKLLGGDANDDDVIDISDAAIIGGQFAKSGSGISDPRADINNDNEVDILDLVLMGGNYSKTISPWTP